MSLYLLLGLGAVVVSLLVGGLLVRLWKRYEERAIEKKWQERERVLDRRAGVASRYEVLRRRARRRRAALAGHSRASSRGRHSGR
ncbi:MAG TPA: hypothetical protein VIE41_18535 [Methylomirabilota bacterium]